MKDFLKKAFPFLTIAASAVPGGNLAMSALGQILKVTPADGKAVTWDDLGAAAINAPPEVRAALQAEENRHVEAMKQMGINSAQEFERISAGDRSDARAREVALKDKYVPFLATVVIGSFILAVLAILRGWGKVEAAFAGTLIGYLAANANQVVSYYFGSSAGSDRKTELMADNTEKK